MSDNFSGDNNRTKLSDLAGNVTYFHELIGANGNTQVSNLSYDHLYTSSDGINNRFVNEIDSNCQTAESEVKFLKEWLLMHLNLIQQQNDEILDKERTILILQQENEMVKHYMFYI